MKRKSIKRKILIGLIFITFINILTLGMWFLCNVEPMVSKKEMLKKEILTKDIKDNYHTFDELINDLDNIKKEKELTFSIEKEKIKKDKQDLYLFSKKVLVNNDEYIVNAYFYKNMSILKLILELLAFQSILLTICMFLVFLFARDKIIKPVNKIIDAFDFDYVGIDFLVGENEELIFNEIEDVVGARMLSQCSDIDYAGMYIDYIKRHMP